MIMPYASYGSVYHPDTIIDAVAAGSKAVTSGSGVLEGSSEIELSRSSSGRTNRILADSGWPASVALSHLFAILIFAILKRLPANLCPQDSILLF